MHTLLAVQQHSSNSRNLTNKRYIESLQVHYKKQQQYHDYPEGFHLVQAYVQRAVQMQHVSRSSNGGKHDSALLQGYETICDQIKDRDDPPMLHKVLLAIGYGETLGYLVRFPQHHGKLLHLIMRLDPFTPPSPKGRPNTATSPATDSVSLSLFTEYAIADAYFALCVAIVSANATFVRPVLESMVRHWSNDAIPALRRTTDYDHEGRMLRVHSTIYNTLRLVPNATSQLFPILAKHFPYKMKPTELIASYVEQIFIVLRYAPSLFANIYELCIRHALQIDVEIRIQDDGNVFLETQHPQPTEDGGVRMEDDDEKKETTLQDEVTTMTNTTKDSSLTTNNTIVSKVDVMADKLDTIMCLIFEHLTFFCQLKIHYVEAYDILLHLFESYIMMTHKSKFVQFLVLFLCGRFQQSLALFTADSAGCSATPTAHPDPLYREFASTLINKILDVRQANIYRQVSTCYLASFISRAQYVNDQTVCETVAVLLQWAHHYIDQFDRSSSSTSSNRAVMESSNMSKVHGVFYSICQAAFYIMCFRGADAWMHYDNTVTKFAKQHIQDERVDEEEVTDKQDDRLSDMDVTLVDIGPHRWLLVCSHPRLQPLKFCLESVRREFLHLAKVLKLLPPEFLRSMRQHDKLVEAHKLQRQKTSSTTNGRRRSTTIQTAATIELCKKKGGGGGGVGGLGKGSNPLDSFFPFDPYLLCRSHKFISPFYKPWDEPGAEIDDKSTEDEGSVDDLDVHDGASSSSDSESSSDCENCSMLHEDDDNDVTKHQENQFVMEMLPCSFEEVIPSYRKQSISSGGSW